eukprot:4003263-Pyramimonas_sp.AAC.1
MTAPLLFRVLRAGTRARARKPCTVKGPTSGEKALWSAVPVRAETLHSAVALQRGASASHAPA